MKVLVYGGREYNDRESVYYTLDDFHAKNPITLIVHGACESRCDMDTGQAIWSADELAEQWAKHNYVPYIGFPAVWYPNGRKRALDRAAGPKRNAFMLAKMKPQAAVEFPGGKGTADMRERLLAAGITPQRVVASVKS